LDKTSRNFAKPLKVFWFSWHSSVTILRYKFSDISGDYRRRVVMDRWCPGSVECVQKRERNVQVVIIVPTYRGHHEEEIESWLDWG
jgi:hypothetical protein